jgi:methionyl-tRNA formyltransferase
MLRIAFLGTPEFTLPLLEACAAAGELALVVAQPDKPVGRHAELKAPASKVWAVARGIRVEQPVKVRNGALAAVIASARPEVAVVAAYGRILPADALAAPRLGCLNVHASLLPKLRGAAPAQWAVAQRMPESGVTIMQMDEGLDTGDIRLQKRLALAPDETGASLLAKLGPLGASALTEALQLLEQGALPRTPQDHSQATLAPILSREDGKLDWARNAFDLDARRRGFTPWPGVWTTVRGQVLKIHDAKPIDGVSGEPGEILQGTTIACGEKTGLRLETVQPEGKKAMPAAAWLTGARLSASDRLGR